MNILAIETTGAYASAAVIDNDDCVHEVISDKNLTHLQEAVPLIDRVIHECGLSFSDVGGIAVSVGPGSFTGIRIGVATAKALAQIKRCAVAQVPTLKAMAMKYSDYEGIVCPVMDARRNQVYSAAYIFEDDEQKEIFPDGAYSFEEMLEMLKDKGKVIFMGDGIVNDKIREFLENIPGVEEDFASPEKRMQSAEMVAVLGKEIFAEGNAVSFFSVEPEYLRKSEAERNLEKKKCSQQ